MKKQIEIKVVDFDLRDRDGELKIKVWLDAHISGRFHRTISFEWDL